MTLTLKKTTLLTAAALTLGFQGISHAQTVEPVITLPSAPTVNTERLEVIPTEPLIATTRTASWQGQDVALNGKDVVSFFGNDAPIEGSQKFVVDWDNTKWRFSSEENRDLFKQDPTKYIPEFGGFCPVALADNHARIGTTTHYTVIDQKLYLNYNKDAETIFKDSPDNFLVRANLNF